MTPLLHIPNDDITLKDSDLRVLFKKKSAVACVTPNWCIWIKEHPWVMTVDTTPCVIPIHDMTYAPKLIRSMMSHAPSFSSPSKLTIQNSPFPDSFKSKSRSVKVLVFEGPSTHLIQLQKHWHSRLKEGDVIFAKVWERRHKLKSTSVKAVSSFGRKKASPITLLC